MNLKDELGFALEKRGDEWLVVEDGADDRVATITEQVLWQALVGHAATTPTDSTTTQAQLREWVPFVPYHARRVLERAAVLLDAAMAVS